MHSINSIKSKSNLCALVKENKPLEYSRFFLYNQQLRTTHAHYSVPAGCALLATGHYIKRTRARSLYQPFFVGLSSQLNSNLMRYISKRLPRKKQRGSRLKLASLALWLPTARCALDSTAGALASQRNFTRPCFTQRIGFGKPAAPLQPRRQAQRSAEIPPVVFTTHFARGSAVFNVFTLAQKNQPKNTLKTARGARCKLNLVTQFLPIGQKAEPQKS
jgi:hypothetical protein